MAWLDTHSITDFPAAYRAARSAPVGDVDLAMGTSDLTTVANAETVALANANNITLTHITNQQFGVNVARGFRIASNLGGTFGSTFAVLEASLPANPTGNKSMMISGS